MIPWYLMAKGGGSYKTASGPIVSVSDAKAAPLRSLVANIDPVQAGSGDPSPDNVRPISGWSAVNVWLKPTYDPTANPTATVQLGDTYYGGTLDVTNGVLTVDRAMVDLGTLIWQKSDHHFFTVDLKQLIKIPADNYTKANVLCSQYETASLSVVYNEAKDCAIAVQAAPESFSGAIHINDTAFASATSTEFKAAMSGVQLCYELATPIEYTLTPQQISSLVGENNVWADSGDVDVEYLASGGANPDLMKLTVAFMAGS